MQEPECGHASLNFVCLHVTFSTCTCQFLPWDSRRRQRPYSAWLAGSQIHPSPISAQEGCSLILYLFPSTSASRPAPAECTSICCYHTQPLPLSQWRRENTYKNKWWVTSSTRTQRQRYSIPAAIAGWFQGEEVQVCSLEGPLGIFCDCACDVTGIAAAWCDRKEQRTQETRYE